MIFEGLKEKMEYYRSLADSKLMPGMYTLVMIDGHNFSRKVKKKFVRPFDEDFIRYMNEVAIHISKEFQGIRFAYTQSDEISFLMTDFTEESQSEAAYGYRVCKLQSLIASEAAAKFNHLVWKDHGEELGLFSFDCKTWQVPHEGDVNGWFVYRQNDCIRNSISQVAQTYFSHAQLMNKTVDNMRDMLEIEKQISWEKDFKDGMKYGRLIYKEDETKYTPTGEPFTRGVWKVHEASKFSGTDIIKNLIPCFPKMK